MKRLPQILTGTALCIAGVLGMVLLDFSDIAVAGEHLIGRILDTDEAPATELVIAMEEGDSPVGVPEPDMLMLMGLGTLGAGVARFLRRT